MPRLLAPIVALDLNRCPGSKQDFGMLCEHYSCRLLSTSLVRQLDVTSCELHWQEVPWWLCVALCTGGRGGGGGGGWGLGEIWNGEIRCGKILVQILKFHGEIWYKISKLWPGKSHDSGNGTTYFSFVDTMPPQLTY